MRSSVLMAMLLSACSGSALPPPLPAPSSLAVDIDKEIVEIPAGTCAGFDGWLAMSEGAARQLVIQERKRETEYELKLAKCDGMRRIAEEQQKQTAAALEHASFWWKYGPLIAVGASVITFGAGIFVGVEAGRMLRLRPPRQTPFRLHIFRNPAWHW